jgi:DNA polymerase-3 subunit alpha
MSKVIRIEKIIKTGSLPDIDLDFENREAVITYMKERYGQNYVCSVGSYTAFQLKQSLKDLAKQKGISFNIVNTLSKLIRVDEGEWDDLFINAIKIPIWKDFIKKNSDIINDIVLILHQPKAKSIHACATLILPKTNEKGENVDIFEQIPVRKEGDLLVSEWEGDELADAKYLKEDILGLKQLEKFKNILSLIKETTGENVDIYNLPLNDKNIYDKLFKSGYNSDVFHFNSILLKAYSQEVKPDNIEDLIAMLALVRPGAIKSGANIDYIKFKSGKKTPIYDYGLKEITKDTYGLLIYQEQIMQICQVLGGFSGSEAEDVRKSMGKLRRELLEPYEIRFIEGAIKNGCSAEEAKAIWNKMVGFADYGFNRSHSVCYAITGYISQWLKYYYPLQFWTTAFEFADNDDKIMSYISEIKKIDSFIQIIPPDINNSKEKFFTDFKQGKIYWSLSKIDSLGPVAVKAIISEREQKGRFFSLEEFFKRVKKSEVNKRNIEHLILAGSFDEIEQISNPIERVELIFKFYDIAGIKEKDYNLLFIEEEIDKEYWWNLRQKEVSGLGYFDYKDIIKKSNLTHLTRLYCDEISFFNTYTEGKKVIIGGIITAIEEKGSKKGKFGQIYIDANDEQIIINYWSKLWDRDNKYFNSESIGKILLITGRVNYNSYSKFNTLQIEDDSEFLFLS